MDDEEPDTKETAIRKMRRKKKETIMPQTVTGWSVLLVAVLCGTGVALVILKERDMALALFGLAGWGGYVTKLIGRNKE